MKQIYQKLIYICHQKGSLVSLLLQLHYFCQHNFAFLCFRPISDFNKNLVKPLFETKQGPYKTEYIKNICIFDP